MIGGFSVQYKRAYVVSNNSNPNERDQRRSVANIVTHSNYKSHYLYNDFLLLILEKPFLLTTSVAPVCLPEDNQVILGDCIVTGWGKSRISMYINNYLTLREHSGWQGRFSRCCGSCVINAEFRAGGSVVKMYYSGCIVQ